MWVDSIEELRALGHHVMRISLKQTKVDGGIVEQIPLLRMSGYRVEAASGDDRFEHSGADSSARSIDY